MLSDGEREEIKREKEGKARKELNENKEEKVAHGSHEF